ncbi:MAG: hypothetical protein EA387_08785 [Nitriliruptor sp.]|nr:MAG: hypothetical protein EA387_08785 [Nitriliruptor sp.]
MGPAGAPRPIGGRAPDLGGSPPSAGSPASAGSAPSAGSPASAGSAPSADDEMAAELGLDGPQPCTRQVLRAHHHEGPSEFAHLLPTTCIPRPLGG